MNQYLKVFIVLFLLWCLYNYINCKQCKEAFTIHYPKDNIYDGRNTLYNTCLNHCSGKRHCDYNNCLNDCIPLQPVSTHDPSAQFDFYNKW